MKRRIEQKRIYAEIGIGNGTLLSTEYENNGKEQRVPRFIKPKHITGYYVRFWMFKTVIIISTNNGFKIDKKNKIRFKFIFGISGTD